MSSVVRATLSDQVHHELRSRILSGALRSGHRLLPEELAQDLAISQTPVKEALLKLEADGLVVSGQRKGVVVRLFTPKDVEELYEARILIELEAIDTLFGRKAMAAAALDRLDENLSRYAFHIKRDTSEDLVAALALDRAFHHHFVQARNNAVIADWHAKILAQTHTAYVYLSGDPSHVYDEHRAILVAIRAGSRPDAKAALRQHLIRSRDSLLANVKERAG
jgi:DNA-binding GntR family transcriptional regulator